MAIADHGLRTAHWAHSGPRRLAAVLLAVALVVPAVAAQQPAQDTTRRATDLVLELDGTPLTDWVVLHETDPLLLTVRARDSLGRAVPVWGFEVEVWDQGVLRVRGTEVQGARALVRLAPGHHGRTTLALRCSGTKQWVLVEYSGRGVALSPGQREAPVVAEAPRRPQPQPPPPQAEAPQQPPPQAEAPQQPQPQPPAQAEAPPPEQPTAPSGPAGPAASAWTLGARADLAFYAYTFHNDTVFAGQAGVLGELFAGREWPSGLVVVIGGAAGLVQADSFTTSVTVKVLQAYARADYAFMRENKVRPVISLGGGMYQARTGTTGAGIWNASLYWMGGAGVDVTLSPRATGEARVMYQDLWEATSSGNNGHVGRLITVGVGARLRLP